MVTPSNHVIAGRIYIALGPWQFGDFRIIFLPNIQGVHKVRVHFKKIITLIVFAIEIICKKDLKEENRYFLRFY